jgi:branched-chain amino acid transport system substrate-binding protein
MNGTTNLRALGLSGLLCLAACGGQAQPAAAPSKATSASPTAKPAGSAATAAKPAGSAATAAKPAGSAATAAKPAASAAGKSYSFGAMLVLTGPAASIGEQNRRGMQLAVDDINAAGGVAGWVLAPNTQDTKATAQGGTEAINQLVNIGKVPFVISEFSGPTLAAQPVVAQNHVLMVNAGGTDSNLLNKPWLYDNQVMIPHLAAPLAKYAWDQGYRKLAMLVTNDAYGDGGRKAFTEAWQKLGGQIVADELFPVNATDFTAQLAKVKAGNPDVVMTVAVGQTQGLVVKQARAFGIQAPFITPLATADLTKIAGPAAEGTIDAGIATDLKTTDPAAKQFIDHYRQKYNEDPDWTEGTIYEVVYLLRDLIDQVTKQQGDPRSGDALLKALEAKPEFHNALAGGSVRFGSDHSVLRTLALEKVVNGKFETISLVPPG